jgi:hypothetical protein
LKRRKDSAITCFCCHKSAETINKKETFLKWQSISREIWHRNRGGVETIIKKAVI